MVNRAKLIKENQARGKKAENIYQLTHPGAERTGRGSDFKYGGEFVEVKSGNAKLSKLQNECNPEVWRIKDADVLDMVPDPEKVKNAIYSSKKKK